MAVDPLISIVTATYNLSEVLRWSIETVLCQTYRNWELLVIGDACTDDTESVVNSFADPRISFRNMEKNTGEQSGPNNEGCRLAQGEYIAFLNHDDLWFPDHLERCLEVLQANGADLVYSLVDRITEREERRIDGIFPDGAYYPGPFVPASSWLFRKQLIDEIGKWQYYKEIYNVPSQDWLFRVWKAGKKIVAVPHLSVIAISGKRHDLYKKRDAESHKHFYEQIKNDSFLRERELEALLFSQQKHLRKSVDYITGTSFGTMLKAMIYKIEKSILLAWKLEPSRWRKRIRFQRKGEFIDGLRRIKGLEKKGG